MQGFEKQEKTQNLYQILNQLFDSACRITGANICIYIYKPIFLATIKNSIQTHRCPWCRLNIECDYVNRPCVDVDVVEAPKQAISLHGSYLKKCYAGITEMVIPVFKSNELLAIIFLGQCRTNNDAISDEHFAYLIKKGISPDKIHIVYSLLPIVDENLLKDTAFLLENALRYIIEVNSHLFTNYLVDTHSYIVEAKNIIQSHIYMPSLSRKYVSEILGITPEYLSKLFKLHMGTTVVKYIQQVRIERARMLLANSEISLSNIAEKCGFSDQNYFARVFRKHMSMTPSEYRTHNSILNSNDI